MQAGERQGVHGPFDASSMAQKAQENSPSVFPAITGTYTARLRPLQCFAQHAQQGSNPSRAHATSLICMASAK